MKPPIASHAFVVHDEIRSNWKVYRKYLSLRKATIIEKFKAEYGYKPRLRVNYSTLNNGTQRVVTISTISE